MCRSIKTLRKPGELAGDDEVKAAALQFVRKVSGFRAPARGNADAFDAAVAEVAASTQRLIDAIGPMRPRPEGAPEPAPKPRVYRERPPRPAEHRSSTGTENDAV